MKKTVMLFLTLVAVCGSAEIYAAPEAPSDTTTALEEIVVKAPLIRRETDRIVINVAANPLAADMNVRELLKTAPGVWATDDMLSIYGQSGATVYIDDRKVNLSGSQLMTYLKSIPSSSVKTIEVIPKAGAEYSADSSGGIIRINLRRLRVDGSAGSAGLQVTAGRYKQWYNPFLNFGLHSGKWTLNFNGNLNGTPGDRYTNREVSRNIELAQEMTGISNHKGKTIQGNVMLGIFYDAGDKDKMGLQLDYNPDRSRNTSDSETETSVPESPDKELTSGRYLSDNRLHNANVTFNWTHTLDDKGSLLKLVSNYNFRDNSTRGNNVMSRTSVPYDSIYSVSGSTRYHLLTSEFSWRKTFGGGWRLDAGAKWTFNRVADRSAHSHLDGTEWIPDRDYDYNSAYRENIAAVYAVANGKAGRWKFKAGIRGEYSSTDRREENGGRFDLFPNANISCGLSDNGDYAVSVGYYRRIGRPSFWSLNPVVHQVSDYSYTVGNPRLKPSFTNSLSLDFVLASKFTIAAGYSETLRPIRQTFTRNPDHPERLYLTWQNYGKDRNMFIHGDGSVGITRWWNLYASATYVITSQKLPETKAYETFGYLRLVVSTTFTLPEGFTLSADCFFNSKMRIGNISVYPILNITPRLRKKFGRHWSVSLGMENLLQRRNRLRTASAGYDRLSWSRSHMAVNIGATWTFNSGKSFRAPRIERNADTSRLAKD